LLRISRALKLLLTSFALLTKLALQLIWISFAFRTRLIVSNNTFLFAMQLLIF